MLQSARLCLLRAGIIVVCAVGIAACGGSASEPDEETPRFVTTIPPFEMILEPIVAGRGEVVRLLDPGTSPHTYAPSPSDLQAVAQSAAVVYGAEHLDGWAADLPGERHLELLSLVPPSARLFFDRPEGGHVHGGHSGDEATVVDPHFWTDPRAVAGLLPALADTLCNVDPQGCATYRANADTFATELATLDDRLTSMMRPVRNRSVLLARPFFRYFLNRYGPRLVGVITLHAGGEPTPREIQSFVQRADTTGVRLVLVQRQQSLQAAHAVAESAGIPLVEIDPLGGTDGRTSYESLLLSNARALLEAFPRDK